MKNNERKKKKIMFLITGSNMGGAEVVVKNIIFNLDKNRFETSFVSIRPLGIIGKEISERTKVFSLFAKQKFNPLFFYKLYKLLKIEKPDILHCHLFHANLVGRIIGKIARVPKIISTVHSDNIGGSIRYFLLRVTDSLNDATVVVSNKIKEGLLKRKVSPESKIKVIYNGVEGPDLSIADEDIINKKRELSIEKNNPILLSVGRLHQVKGHIYLIRALKLIVDKFPNGKLILIGDGPERENLEKEVLDLDLINNVLFLGEMKAEDIYYRIADVFVLPSLVEGFGLVLLKAMSNNCLVVASQVGGVPELIEDNINGCLVDSANSKVLAQKIIDIQKLNDSERLNIIRNARESYLEKFILEKTLKSYVDLYI